MSQNPPGNTKKTKGWTSDPEEFNQTQINQVKVKAKKQDAKEIKKHLAWHTKSGKPSGGTCPECRRLGL